MLITVRGTTWQIGPLVPREAKSKNATVVDWSAELPIRATVRRGPANRALAVGRALSETWGMAS